MPPRPTATRTSTTRNRASRTSHPGNAPREQIHRSGAPSLRYRRTCLLNLSTTNPRAMRSKFISLRDFCRGNSSLAVGSPRDGIWEMWSGCFELCLISVKNFTTSSAHEHAPMKVDLELGWSDVGLQAKKKQYLNELLKQKRKKTVFRVIKSYEKL